MGEREKSAVSALEKKAEKQSKTNNTQSNIIMVNVITVPGGYWAITRPRGLKVKREKSNSKKGKRDDVLCARLSPGFRY